jgi:GTP-binding protein Era
MGISWAGSGHRRESGDRLGPRGNGRIERVADGTFRSGFCCFVGRPNAGKSTLVNALVGEKVAITSSKPQTTRHAIRGILHRPDAQLVVVDTPGLHRPRTLLGERLNDVVLSTLSDVDVIGFCVAADQPVGAGDRYIAEQLTGMRAPVVAVLTKTDLAKPPVIVRQLADLAALGSFAEVVPVSAVDGSQIDLLADLLVAHLPVAPPLYPREVRTDEPTESMIAELIREAALEGVRDELPHSIAVTVAEMQEDGGLTRIFATIHVERDSQKGIVLGHRGARLRAVGTTARAGIEALLGTRVYLDLRVSVLAEWQRDPKKLDRLGF